MTAPHEQTDEALHEQREWLRVTLSSIGDAVITTDMSGSVTFLNPVAQSLTGWTQEDAAGKPLEIIFKIVNEGTRLAVESPAKRALLDGVVVGLANHTLLIAKDGTERPIDDSAAPIRNGKGNVCGVVLIFRDVTERKREEQIVEDALAYADNIIATLREPFVVLEKNLRVVTANDSFYRKFHVTPEETQGRFIYDLGNRQWDIPRLRELLDEVLPENHAFQDFAIEHEFSTIGRKFMLLNARRIVKPGNHSELILLAIEDITERKLAEQLVQDARTYADNIISTLREPFVILDNSLRVQRVNRSFCQTFHVSQEESANCLVYDLGNGQWNIPKLRTLLEDVLPQNHSFDSFEVEHDFPTIGRKFMLLNARTIRSPGNDSELILLAIEDITERKRLESERHLLEIQMRDQAVVLEDLHRRKDEFLAMLSHELRNPLAPITSAVQLLSLQKNEDQLQHKARTIIERQVGQLTRLIDDLLEVSRITTGRIHLQQERIALNRIVENAVETVRPQIVRHKHELTVSLSSQPIWLFADAARLEQVVVNLLTNAAKFTHDAGQIWLAVQQEGDECVLRVRDNGVGIGPETLPHIFDLFTQAERSLDRSQGGLGIGLALVERIVKMHKGRVEAFSELGQGSEFVVHLPVMAASANQPSATHEGVAQPNEQSLRVLVVDDNEDAAELLGMLLLKSGHEVLTVHDGPSTLIAAQEFRPNVVLLDIGLPGIDGYEVAKKIRDQAIFKNVVLVAMTGYGQESDRKLSQEAGFDHHLVKPPDFNKLQQILADVSDRTCFPQNGNDDLSLGTTKSVELLDRGCHDGQEYRPE